MCEAITVEKLSGLGIRVVIENATKLCVCMCSCAGVFLGSLDLSETSYCENHFLIGRNCPRAALRRRAENCAVHDSKNELRLKHHDILESKIRSQVTPIFGASLVDTKSGLALGCS